MDLRRLLALYGGAALIPAAAAVPVALMSGCGGESVTLPSGDAASRPNFVVILGDDLDLTPIAYMPQLRELVTRRGLTFTNAFCTNPLCCPSRATLLTGQYAHNHSILANDLPKGGFDKFRSEGRERQTIGRWLMDGGYRTGLVGKYLNQYPGSRPQNYIPEGWSEFYTFFSDLGSDAYFNYSMNENGQVVYYGRGSDDYITDVLTQRSLEFLQRTEKNDAQPFFLYINPNAPHRPADPAPRHEALLPDVKAPRTPSWNEANLDDKPAWLRLFEPFTPDSDVRIDWSFRMRALSMLAVDEMIGRIVAELTALGEMDNTYIIFLSDNGFLMGPHRFERGKDAPYEESIRVPMVVRGPGVPSGAASTAFVLNNDLAPTLLNLAGLPIPTMVDGLSLVPVLDGKAHKDWRSDFLIEHWSPDGEGIPDYAGLRNERYAYIEYVTGEREIYDLLHDPYQLVSLHNVMAPSAVAGLKSRLAALRNCAGTVACR